MSDFFDVNVRKLLLQTSQNEALISKALDLCGTMARGTGFCHANCALQKGPALANPRSQCPANRTGQIGPGPHCTAPAATVRPTRDTSSSTPRPAAGSQRSGAGIPAQKTQTGTGRTRLTQNRRRAGTTARPWLANSTSTLGTSLATILDIVVNCV